jgi:hypothetical protein
MLTTDVLYIHPVSFSEDIRLPMGVIGLMNSLNCSKRGVYGDQVTDNDLAHARIVAMDLHWMFHLRPVEKLAERCKAVNPSCMVIIGGYTAAIFADILIERFAVDFIVLGDAEGTFRPLVERILAKRPWDTLPNLVAKTGRTEQRYSLTAQDFNAVNNLSIDWFPQYKKLITEKKAGIPFVFIPVARGCCHDCAWCYGSRKLQLDLCKRPLVVRDAAAVKNDLVSCSGNADVREVSIIADFFELERLKLVGPHYRDVILSQRYDVDMYLECYNLPSIGQLERLEECFTRITVAVSFLRDHGQSARWNDPRAVDALARWSGGRKNFRLLVYGDTNNAVMREKALTLGALYNNVLFGDDTSWRIAVPYPSADRSALAGQFAFFHGIEKWESSGRPSSD